jgi:Flp pilus assembly protein TadG
MRGLKRRGGFPRGRHGRRGTVVVPVVVCSLALIGFAALAVDVGHLYCTRAELQRTADASAMAAAGLLADYTDGDPLPRARQCAQALATRNTVLGSPITLSPTSDIIFGRAAWDEFTRKYTFTPTESCSNAVRVRVRRTADSSNGAVPLFFANVFGQSRKDMSAEATAILTPRDIVFVLDLSASHNDDSCLRSYKNTDIANRDVWQSLWDTQLAESLGIPRPTDGGEPAGPFLGNMNAWGTRTTGPGWDFAGDAGLVRLRKGSSWSLTSAYVSQTLSGKGYGTYTSQEMSAINSSAYDSSTSAYQRRVLVALGVYRWKSGKSGGQPGGNGDNVIDASEVETMVPYPSSSTNPSTLCKDVGGSWTSFVSYVSSSSSHMCQYDPSSMYYGDPGLQYRFGLKTFVDFLQENETGDSTSPGLRGAPEQPMGAVADATKEMIDIVNSLEGSDLIGMASYGTYGYGPADKPNNMSWLTDDLNTVRNKVDTLQAGMWTGNTNMAQGIDKGVDVLFNSPVSPQRKHAAKIMILLTDGQPNQTRANPTKYYSELCTTCPPRADAKAAAHDAHDQKFITIYTISVGANADQVLMAEIADIGGGEHFHAEGSVDTYKEQLQQIFQKLGGKCPVELIQ